MAAVRALDVLAVVLGDAVHVENEGKAALRAKAQRSAFYVTVEGVD